MNDEIQKDSKATLRMKINKYSVLDVNFINMRDLQRNSKQLSEDVNKTDKLTIVISKNKPLFAIVSLKAVEALYE